MLLSVYYFWNNSDALTGKKTNNHCQTQDTPSVPHTPCFYSILLGKFNPSLWVIHSQLISVPLAPPQC